MLAKAIAKLELIGPVLVIPVPLRASKRRQRGFNQAESIARVALKSMREKRFQLAAGVLQRVRPTVSQIGLTRPQRRQNMRGAFNVAHLNKVSGRGILLVDDVMTTGTTVAECARVLRRAGARNVWVATVARTLKNNGESSVVERTAVAVNE
jgi:ComF family protein